MIVDLYFLEIVTCNLLIAALNLISLTSQFMKYNGIVLQHSKFLWEDTQCFFTAYLLSYMIEQQLELAWKATQVSCKEDGRESGVQSY